MQRLALASDNPGKLREFRALLAPLQFEVIAQRELGVSPADEPHPTFVENALAKARNAAAQSGLPALADDSGLCCLALAGAPGVRSARLAGTTATDADNNAELLRRLRGMVERRAHYTCVLVFVQSADDPEPLIAEGHWHGLIVDAPCGTNGFGYDPYFLVPERQRTAAELDPAEKNRISHRGQAMAALLKKLRDRLLEGPREKQ